MEQQSAQSRRSFLGKAASAGATSFLILRPEQVRGAGKEMIRAGVVGTGGRGTAAIADFLTGTENTEVIAMGDLFEDRLETSIRELREDDKRHPRMAKVRDRFKVAPDMRFTGFDAYKKVINAPGVDVVFLATPPGYRPEHFEAAVNAGKHVFCEKPFGTDPVGVRRFMDAARKSVEKKLTVMSGAQRRNQWPYVDTVKQIQDGKIGDLVAAYAYWVGTPVIQQRERKAAWNDMEWQHRAWYSHVWLCGDQIVEQHLHNIDVIRWVTGQHPTKVFATGGAAWRPRQEIYGNIYDHIAADFEFANGLRLSSYCRQVPRADNIFMKIGEEVVGTKGRSNCRDMSTKERENRPYEQEHTEMLRSIRGDGPYINQGLEVAESTMMCIMARESAYSGQAITWDQIMASPLDLRPKTTTLDTKPDVPPLPVPGVYKFS